MGIRSYPFGAIATGQVGYGFLLWGPSPMEILPAAGPPAKPPDWKFGFTRLWANIQTIGLVNRASAEWEVFPVSIFGLAVGQGGHARVDQSSIFDCAVNQCGGFFGRTYLRSQLIVGAKGLFLLSHVRFDWIYPDSNRPFVEDHSTLLGAPGGDRLLTTSLMLGYLIREGMAAGITYQRAWFMDSRNHHFSAAGVFNWFFGRLGVSVGAGAYGSSHQDIGPTFGAQIQWVGQRPLALF